MTRYNELTPFSIAFAAAYRGFMAENNVTGKDIAGKLGRNTGYISERINGKRALDTEDVDALAILAGNGWDGAHLFLELVRRASEANARPNNVSQFPVRDTPAEPNWDEMDAGRKVAKKKSSQEELDQDQD